VAPLALALLTALAALAVPVSAADPKRAAAPEPTPPGLAEFMGGLAQQESGGRYNARNASSGAFGKYQIMPFNWPSWARRYLRHSGAPQSPKNQERVAAGRLTDLYRAYGAWERTAYWWLTGKKGPRSTWSKYATHYVDNVMAGYRLRRATPMPGGVKVLDDGGGTVRFAGRWRQARHPDYVKGGVHYSKSPGAAVGVRFWGRSIRFEGPKGPTRGRVAVYVDGRRIGVVDLRARTFQPHQVLVAVQWTKRAEHWVELRVLRSPGRPFVAIDRLVIRG
jgi:hypothetical protein